MARRMLVLGFFIGAVGGCTSDAIDGPIDYLSGGTGGLYDGDGTSDLHVALNGTVERPKAGGGMESATLDRAILDDLHRKILDAQFPELDSEYACSCPHDFVHVVSVQINGKPYSVVAYNQAPPPPRLKIVIDTLGSISQAPLDWH